MLYQKTKKFSLYAILGTIFIINFFVFVKNSYATDYSQEIYNYDLYNYNHSGHFDRASDYALVMIIDATTTITQFSIYVSGTATDSNDSNNYPKICYDDANGCVHIEGGINAPTGEEIVIHPNWELYPGNHYFHIIYSGGILDLLGKYTTDWNSEMFCTSSHYGINNCSEDLPLIEYFKITSFIGSTTVEIINLPSDITNISIFDEDNPVIPLTKECFYDNTPCRFDFKYFPDMNGSQVSIAYENGETFLGTVNITDLGKVWNNIYTEHIDLVAPDPPSEQEYNYELYYQRNGQAYKTEPFKIFWYNSLTTKISNLANKSLIINKCLDKVSDFTYSECVETENLITCGLKNAVNWSFGFSTTTCILILTAQENLNSSFPLNIIYDMEDTVQNSIDNSTSSDSTVIAPLIWYNKNTHTYDNVGSLLSVNTFKNALSFGNIDGLTVYDFYFLWFKRIIWLFVFGYIFFRIIKGFNIGYLRKDTRDQSSIVYNRNIESIKTNRQQQKYYEKLMKKL